MSEDSPWGLLAGLGLPHDLEQTGNLVEAGFWVLFGVALAFGARHQPRTPRVLALAGGLVSVLFGLSDLVEARTGAWWRPWWLLAWKGACVAGLVLCALGYWRWKGTSRTA